ncbi:MAG: hypothetical protein Fur0043_12600 [Anaerolineales bacterium]
MDVPMKKALCFSLMTLTLLACSTADLVTLLVTPTVSPSPLPPPTETPTQTPTITLTQPTPTFTYTPTMIGLKPTATDTVTGTPPATETPEVTPTSEGSIIVFPESTGFFSALISEPVIYYGKCGLPKEARIGVRVVDTGKVKFVAFFMRLRSKSSGNATGWDIGTVMQAVNDGLYTLTLDADDLHRQEPYSYYKDAWVEFQLVATNAYGQEVARTAKVTDQLSLSPCPEQ